MLTPIFDSGSTMSGWSSQRKTSRSQRRESRGSSIPVRPGTRRTSDGNRARAPRLSRAHGCAVRLMKLDKENVPAGHQTLVKPTLRQADDAPVVPPRRRSLHLHAPAPFPSLLPSSSRGTRDEDGNDAEIAAGIQEDPSAAKSPSSRNKKDDPKVEKPKEQPLTPVKPATPEKKVD